MSMTAEEVKILAHITGKVIKESLAPIVARLEALERESASRQAADTHKNFGELLENDLLTDRLEAEYQRQRKQ